MRTHVDFMERRRFMLEQEEQERREAELRALIEAQLLELAELLGPEDTLAYVEKIASQMRDEIAEGV